MVSLRLLRVSWASHWRATCSRRGRCLYTTALLRVSVCNPIVFTRFRPGGASVSSLSICLSRPPDVGWGSQAQCALPALGKRVVRGRTKAGKPKFNFERLNREDLLS